MKTSNKKTVVPVGIENGSFSLFIFNSEP